MQHADFCCVQEKERKKKMKAKKFLSLVLAASVLTGTASAVSAEETAGANTGFDAGELTINDYGNGFVNPPYSLNYGVTKAPVYGNARLYKLENVFGLGEGEYGVEMVAREQRNDQPFFLLKVNDEDIDMSNDFYVSANLYIGETRDTDYLRLGGEFNDNGKRVTSQYAWLNGRGIVQYTARPKDDTGRRGAAFEPNNWYNVTMSYDKADNKIKTYIDGKPLNNARFMSDAWKIFDYEMTSDTLTNLGFGVRIQGANDETDFGGKPGWVVLKDMKMVKQAYNSENSSTALASDWYTVESEGFHIESGATADKAVSKVSGIEAGTTAAELLDNMIIPDGCSVSVVKISDDDKKTINVAGNEKVTSDMELFVKSADGSMKLYDLDVEVSEDVLPKISLSGAPSRYTFDETSGIFTVPDTTVGTLKSYIVPSSGTTVKIMNYDETIEREDANPVTDTMKVVAEKNGKKAIYNIEIRNTTAIEDTTEILKKHENGVVLLAGSFTSATDFTATTDLSNRNRLVGIGDKFGGSAVSLQRGTSGDFSATKETLDSGTPAYKFVTNADGWVQNNTGTSGAALTNYSLGTKTIINYKVKLAEGAMSEMYTYQTKPDGGGILFTGTGTDGTNGIGFRLAFKYGNILFGRAQYHTGNSLNLGKYENDREYDVTIAAQTPNNTSEIVIEGIYIDGEKIFPKADNQKAEDGFYHIAGSTSLYSLIRSVNFGVQGTSYLGGVKVYMADDYNPDKAAFVDETTEPIIPDRVTDFGVTIESPLTEGNSGRIYGWDGMTAGEIKAKIDSSVNTAVSICDASGSTEIKDTSKALENGMIIKIQDVNYADNALYYVLASQNSMGTWESGTEKKEDGSVAVSITRTIKIYDPIAKTPLTYALAAYADGKLIEVGIGNTVVERDGSYVLKASVAKADGATYKAMLWNTDTQTPFGAAVPVTVE